MLTAIMVLMVLNTLFTMAAVGHLSNVEKIAKSLADSRIAELKMWTDGGRQ